MAIPPTRVIHLVEAQHKRLHLGGVGSVIAFIDILEIASLSNPFQNSRDYGGGQFSRAPAYLHVDCRVALTIDGEFLMRRMKAHNIELEAQTIEQCAGMEYECVHHWRTRNER